MMRLVQTLSILAAVLTFSLTYTEANLRASVAQQRYVDEVIVSLDNQKARGLGVGGSNTEEDDDTAGMGMGNGA